jgi:hypothetical protein
MVILSIEVTFNTRASLLLSSLVSPSEPSVSYRSRYLDVETRAKHALVRRYECNEWMSATNSRTN